MVRFGPNFVDDAGIPEGNIPTGTFGDVVDCLGNVVDKSDVDYHKGIVDSFLILVVGFGPNFVDDNGILEGNVPAGSFGDGVDCLGNVFE